MSPFAFRQPRYKSGFPLQAGHSALMHAISFYYRNYGYTAYRQITWWAHGVLRRDRVVLPSCAVMRIREEFPSIDGNYVGFLP